MAVPQSLRSRFRRSDFFFVQVGANDGVTDDKLHDLVMEYPWRGLLIEPIPYVFERLRETYRAREGLVFERIAVASHEGSCVLWALPQELAARPAWDLSVLATTRRHLFTHPICLSSADGARLESQLLPIVVSCTTLARLVDVHHINHIDLLQIDAQGDDYDVIRSLDFSRIKPRFINFEHVLLEDRTELCQRFLEGLGYIIQPGIDERYDSIAVLE